MTKSNLLPPKSRDLPRRFGHPREQEELGKMEPETFLVDIDQDTTPDQQTQVVIQNLQSEGWQHIETVRLWGRGQMVFNRPSKR
jgi:hypothetical protein